MNQREPMKRLLERSSLGTPGARSLRAALTLRRCAGSWSVPGRR